MWSWIRTRLAAVTGAVPNAGMLLHQGALPIGMRVVENQLASQQLPPKLFPSLLFSLLAGLSTGLGA